MLIKAPAVGVAAHGIRNDSSPELLGPPSASFRHRSLEFRVEEFQGVKLKALNPKNRSFFLFQKINRHNYAVNACWQSLQVDQIG